MRIGIFGGSFDPVHQGHLILAEQCRQHARLDEVRWVPAAQSPLKQDRVMAADPRRVEMLRLAIGGHPSFTVSTCELDRGGVSYTVETLQQLAEAEPDHEWFLLIGGDSLASLDRWHQPARICELATPVVYARPGTTVDVRQQLSPWLTGPRLETACELALTSRQIDISSTDIRQRTAAGDSIRYLVPAPVEILIAHNSLYGGTAPADAVPSEEAAAGGGTAS